MLNDNDVEDAIRFKTKKIRQFNSDELADTMKNAVKRSSNLMIIDKDTGDIIFNSQLCYNMKKPKSKGVCCKVVVISPDKEGFYECTDSLQFIFSGS